MNNTSFKEYINNLKHKCTVPQIATSLCNLSIKKCSEGYRCKSFLHEGTNENSVFMTDSYWYSHSDTKNSHGDVIDLVAFTLYDGNKGNAIRKLGEFLNYTYDNPLQINKKYESEQNQLNFKIEAWHNDLMNNPDGALSYITNRKISIDTINECKLGYCKFKDIPSIIIPMFKNNNVIYYISRTLKKEDIDKGNSKYKKPYITGYNENDIFGLETLSRNKNELVICEGAFDYLSFYQEGFMTLSNFGGNWSKNQKNHLITICKCLQQNNKHFKTILTFDNDSSGKGFTFSFSKLLFENGIKFDIVSPPSEMNSDGSYIKREDGKPITKDISDYYCDNGNLVDLVNNHRTNGLEYLFSSFKSKEEFTEYYIPKRIYISAIDRINLISSLKQNKNILHLWFHDNSDELIYWFKYISNRLISDATENEIADIVLKKHSIIHCNGTGYMIYDSNFWKSANEDEIKTYINDVLKSGVTSNKLNTVEKVIRTKTHTNQIQFNYLNLFNFCNGTLELDTGIFREHRKEDYLNYIVDYPYNKDAKCDAWEKYLNDVFYDDKKNILLQEYLGYCLSKSTHMEKALFVVGNAENGKSVTTDVIESLFSSKDTASISLISHVPIDKMKEPFHCIELMNKAINIVSESGNIKGISGEEFKRIVTGENTKARNLYQDFTVFKPIAKHIFTANSLPKFTDLSDGVYRRMLILIYPYKFVSSPSKEYEKKKDTSLKAKLTSKDALSGIFNWIYEGYINFKKFSTNQDFTYPSDMIEALKNYKAENNSILSFILEFKWVDWEYENNHLVSFPIEFISSNDLYRRYKRYCEDYSIKDILNYQTFTNKIKHIIESNRDDMKYHVQNGKIRGYKKC